MATNSDDDHEDLVTYTKEWIGKVNRGGLFPLNNLAYIFFIAVEKEVKVLLTWLSSHLNHVMILNSG